MDELILNFNLDDSALGHFTSSIQFGFAIGTFLFAILTIADRFLPSRVFLTCAILGALFNLGLLLETIPFSTSLVFRFFTGFFLAGIYPVGMKIASDYFDQGLGKSLGFLVGALVLGKAFPHFIKTVSSGISWEFVIISTSLFALFGGLIMVVFVPLGPYSKKSSGFHFSAFFRVFQVKKFRQAAFGYFGHMWELYTFWAFVPVLISTYSLKHDIDTLNTSFWSFLIIAIGGVSCGVSGIISKTFGTKNLATFALASSGVCCLLCPFLFFVDSTFIFLGFLLLWGVFVIADSPLFSTLVAQNAIPIFKGTALTIVNCIGFAITIISIELLTYVSGLTGSIFIYSILALGPILGLVKLWR